MSARIAGRLILSLLPMILLALYFVPSGRGQESLASRADLDADYSKIKPQLQKYLSGEITPKTKEEDKLIEGLARWFVFRVTVTPYKDNMEKLHSELEQNLLHPLLVGKNNKVFIDKLGEPLAKCFKEVFAKSFAEYRAAIVNAALMLPPVAKLKQDKIGDLLADLLNDEKVHDSVKSHVVKALGEFFPATIHSDPKSVKEKAQFARDLKRFKALTDFIHRPVPASMDEDAYRFLRREGVTALAQAGVPALSGLDKGSVQGPVAYELLRVLLKKGEAAYKPPTTLAERVEAALGLGMLKDANANIPHDLDIVYDPSMTVYAVGLCFHDFMSEYSREYLGSKLVDRKKLTAIGEGSKIPTIPWRIYNHRFKAAAKELVDNTKGTPVQAKAVQLAKEINRLADSMLKYADVGADVAPLGMMIQSLSPATKKVYGHKGEKGLEIDPADLKEWPAAAANNG
jgi:hypothetical protein